jgi:succinyl-CoA synthetase alpha subunit
MALKGMVKRGEYFDSVSLMRIAKKINQKRGVIDSAVVMGTRENKSILKASGFLIQEFKQAQDTDLLIVIKARNEKIVDAILQSIDQELKKLRINDKTTERISPQSLEGAIDRLPDANLCVISIAGRYAAGEAEKALKKGLHVFLFSDNVSLPKEIELKKYAQQKNLFLMGPDCGSAIINGVPIGFANVVRKGNIGIVAASGSGLQEVTSLISNRRGGISQAIGTGGRDVKKEVGGIMFITALKALGQDENTKAILLISKPPHISVLKKIAGEIKRIKKPIVATFLGADPEIVREYGIRPASNLEEGVDKILELAGIRREPIPYTDIEKIAKAEVKKLNKNQKYLRGLFTGGTLCVETQIILKGINNVFSNIPALDSRSLTNSSRSERHTLIDLGEDEFTIGRPHPMIDFTTRNNRILSEAKDIETAIILLDLVLGYGANMKPLSEINPVLRKVQQIANKDSRYISIICSVTGTDKDPQNRKVVVEALEQVGVIVCNSNAEASRLSKQILINLGGNE